MARRTPRILVLLAAAAAGVTTALLLPGSHRPAARGAAGTTRPPSLSTGATGPAPTAPATPATTALPVRAGRTSTTVDPGSLPQTAQRPTASDPLFQAHVRDLWTAVVDDRPSEALPFFFPLGAYIQVKAIPDPVHDYRTRLIANFYQDVGTLHARLGAGAASAVFDGVSVPDAARWILPGVEYNKGSYWRVYGTAVTYTLAGRRSTFEITSMISWRGEWYVVHLGAIR